MKHKADELTLKLPYFDEEGGFHFQPVSSDARLAFCLQPFPKELVKWFERFEVNCTFDCCGLRALGFKSATQWDKRWRYNSKIMEQLQSLQDEVERAPAPVLQCKEFQESLYKDDFLFLLQYLQVEMQRNTVYK